jgi:hypothetical protein
MMSTQPTGFAVVAKSEWFKTVIVGAAVIAVGTTSHACRGGFRRLVAVKEFIAVVVRTARIALETSSIAPDFIFAIHVRFHAVIVGDAGIVLTTASLAGFVCRVTKGVWFPTLTVGAASIPLGTTSAAMPVTIRVWFHTVTVTEATIAYAPASRAFTVNSKATKVIGRAIAIRGTAVETGPNLAVVLSRAIAVQNSRLARNNRESGDNDDRQGTTKDLHPSQLLVFPDMQRHAQTKSDCVALLRMITSTLW